MRGIAAFVVGAVAGAALTGAVVVGTNSSSDESDDNASEVSLSTTQIVVEDIVLTDDTVATLEFVADTVVAAPAAGTITSTVSDGSTIEAGTVVATIDSAPVVALYGDIPAWRDLDDTSEDGVDIYQLELNLVMLGFDPDGAIAIDREFDDATENAVELWQESLGLDVDGVVPQNLVTYVEGQVLVDGDTAVTGSSIQQGGALATGRILERVKLVASTSDDDGPITSIATTGTEVSTGTVLFIDAGAPVIAIEGDQASIPLLERDLSVGVTAGQDVELFESALATMGFDAGGTLVVDDEFDAATSQAVYDWYQSLGLAEEADPAAMTVPAGSFVVVSGGLEVGLAVIADGTDPGVETPVLTLTQPARVVSTTVPLGDDTFALGAIIQIDYPDGTTTEGSVTSIGNVATNATETPDAVPAVPVVITPNEIPASVEGFVEIPVTLRIVTETIPDAFVVPVSALVALAEGGYALEVSDGAAASHLIGVELGTFIDGFVEITGADVSAGLEVVIPA